MNLKMQLPLAALALGLTFVACSDDDPSPQPMMDAGMPDSGMMGPTLTSIAIMPDAATVDIGGTQQLTIMGTFDDSSMAAVTMGITWMSDNTAVAVVGATGVVTGVAEGTATITADVDGVTDTITVTVAIPPVELVVFDDEFGNDVQFNAFAPTVISVDTTESQVGDASLRIEIPSDPPNGFIGGALALINPQDLSGFNAVTFWAKGTSARAMNVIGIANDSTNTEFQAEWGAVNITTEWQQYTIPLPDPSLLTEQAGLLHFAEGTEDGVGDIFLDDIKYVVLDPAVAPTGAAMAALEIGLMTGETANVVGQVINYMVGDQAVTLIPRARYFTYMSNNTAVATVDAQGVITGVGVGTATITATFGGAAVGGQVEVTVTQGVQPMVAAPTPTNPAGDVLSIFSDAYTPIPLNLFDPGPPWDAAEVNEISVEGNAVKRYSYVGDSFAGITFEGPNSLDLTGYTNVRIDVWAPTATQFRIRLVDFGPDNEFDDGGDDDSASELTYDMTTSPALANETWVTFDIPLSLFTELNQRANLSQMILSVNADGSPQTVFYDNILFYR